MALARRTYFLPTQITGCSLWLDGADTSSASMILSGSNVSTWKDKSGTGNNATANTGTVTTNSTTINGLNTIRFNTSSFLNIASFSMTANISVFAVLRGVGTQGSGNAGYFFLGTGAQPSFFVYTLQPQYGNLSGPYSAWVASTGETNWYMPSSDFFLNNPGFIYTDNSTSFVNGSQLTFNTNRASVPNTVTAGTYSLQVGGRVQADSLAFDFAECIFFNRTITSTERQRIEGYLSQKWGLTASLPAGHPGLTTILYRTQPTPLTKIPYFVKFSPTQISGCSLWLDGADPAGNGVIPAIGASIATWADKSGQNQTITQSTTGNQALYTAGGGLTFTSGMQYPLNTSVFMNIFSIAYTIFVVEKRATSGLGFFIGNNAGGGGPLYLGYNANTAMRFTLAQVVDLDYTVPAYSGSDATEPTRIWACRWFGSAANLRDIGLNGQITPLSQSFNLAPSFSGNQTIGGCVYGNYVGKMYEMIIFNRAISNSEKQQVESYLAQKWRLSLVLPAAHLNTTFPAGSPAAIQAFIPSIRSAVSSIPFIGGGSGSSSGIYSIRTFLTTGQLILSKSISATILVVGGGGGGGSAGVQTGGGGAGGAVFVSSPVTITAGIYTVTVGTGGGINTNGTNSTFLSYTGVGGGGGGNWINGAGKTGGCGGGGSGEGGSGAAGSQGFGGANGRGQFTCGGGGGGMGQAGKQPADGSPSSGGNGLQYSITGSSVYYAGGGAGGYNGASTGGLGGGGDKTLQGTDGLGGGGGSGARGGNGVVILSFVFL